MEVHTEPSRLDLQEDLAVGATSRPRHQQLVVLDQVIHSQEHLEHLHQMGGVMMVVLELQDLVVPVVLVVAVVPVVWVLREHLVLVVMVELVINYQQHIEILHLHLVQLEVV